jgi:hypothetical protein
MLNPMAEATPQFTLFPGAIGRVVDTGAREV